MKKRIVEVEGELEHYDGWSGTYWRVGDDNLEEILRENQGRKVRVTIEFEES